MDKNARLAQAIKKRDLRRVKEVLATGADPNAPLDADGRTALSCAVSAEDEAIIRFLLDSGARLSAERGRNTALHRAASLGNQLVLHLLLTSRDGRRALTWVDPDGCTPLMRAVQDNRRDVVKLLLAAGADVNAKDPATGNTALRIAAAEGTPAMVRLLLEAGADPLAPGRMLLTPLDRARERRTADGRVITSLIEKALASSEASSPRPQK